MSESLSPIECPTYCSDAWILFPLYRRCQNCGRIESAPDGWRWLKELAKEVAERKDSHD